jgi:hypothetical protein
VLTAAINTKRDGHYIAAVRSTLLEDARTNSFIRSQEFDNAAWTKDGTTVSANAATAPDGTGTADKLLETATNAAHQAYQTSTTTASTTQAYSFFVAAGERTWAYIQTGLRDGSTPRSWVNLATGAIGTTGSGHNIRVTAVSHGFYRVEIAVNSLTGANATYAAVGAATGDAVFSYLGDITKGIYVWGGQHERDCSFASSYIPTVAATVTRGADSYSLPFTTPPQESTLYAKFVEGGTLAVSGGICGNGESANASFSLFATGSNYSIIHREAADVTSGQGAAPSIGQVNELRGVLFGDGSVQSGQSIAGAAETLGAQSAASPLATAWANQILLLNARFTGNNGFTALQSFKIVAGARSLSEMRGA